MSSQTLALASIAAAMLLASAASAAQRSYDRTLDAPPGGQLTLDTDVGSVVVDGHHAPQVIIHAQLTGSQSFVDSIQISAGSTASGVTISAHEAGGPLHWLSFDWLGVASNRARFVIEVPSHYPLDLHTAGGDIHVRNVEASVLVTSSGGDTHLRNVAGAVNAHTSGGDARLQDITGTVDVHTGGGDIEALRLDGPVRLASAGGDIHVEDSTGCLDLHSGGGGIRLRGDSGIIRAASSGGSVRAQLSANQGISLRSGGGDVTLLLPAAARGSLDAESGGGSITSDFPLNTTQIDSGTHLAGTMGGRGALISLQSSGGDIRIATQQ